MKKSDREPQRTKGLLKHLFPIKTFFIFYYLFYFLLLFRILFCIISHLSY